MQLQVGEGAGSQNRTVYSLRDMTTTSLGKTKFRDYFDNPAFTSEKYLAVDDLMSGGLASLETDAVKAMTIVGQAIKDVSDARADIGAFQSNMLETNANSLQVAFEKITETESYTLRRRICGVFDMIKPRPEGISLWGREAQISTSTNFAIARLTRPRNERKIHALPRESPQTS
jgi:hypothetical protein